MSLFARWMVPERSNFPFLGLVLCSDKVNRNMLGVDFN